MTDVPGVMVGHATLAEGPLQTGVTMIVPHPGNLYMEKVPAAACVLNGFGKTVGLMQLIELGALESPIGLTNTFSVGTVATALIRRAVAATPEIGRSMSTMNPVVAECNDGHLNDLVAFAIGDVHCDAALATASADFERGSIGAGRGMSCFGLKGGIGTSSRIVTLDGMPYTLGALVPPARRTLQFMAGGASVRRWRPGGALSVAPCGHGSIIVVLATDACRCAAAPAHRVRAGTGTGAASGMAAARVVALRLPTAFPSAGAALRLAHLAGASLGSSTPPRKPRAGHHHAIFSASQRRRGCGAVLLTLLAVRSPRISVDIGGRDRHRERTTRGNPASARDADRRGQRSNRGLPAVRRMFSSTTRMATSATCWRTSSIPARDICRASRASSA